MILNHLAAVRAGRVCRSATAAVAIAGWLLSSTALRAQTPAFNWIDAVDSSGQAYPLLGMGTDALGNVYVAGSTKSQNLPVVSAVQPKLAMAGSYDVFVTKLDPSGHVVYSTYFGGSADDIARAVAVDSAGNIYVVGTTASQDFPTTRGSWSPQMPPAPPYAQANSSNYEGAVFLFKLGPNGSVGYSTYFTSQTAPVDPQSVAVDAAGAAYIAGTTYGGLPATSGAYKTACGCGSAPSLGFSIPFSDAFLAKFDSTGSALVYATYLGVPNATGNAVAAAADGSTYLASSQGVFRFNSAGSSLLGSIGPVLNASAILATPGGRVYLAGQPGSGSNAFQPTPGAFQSDSIASPPLPIQGSDPPIGIMLLDASLQNVLAATYFSQHGGGVNAMALDASGNLYLGGSVKTGLLPTRTPLQEGFGGSLATGFAAELTGDLSTLLFSSYFGDGDYFYVSSVAVGSNGALILGGPTDKGTVWVNSVQPGTQPPLRIDAVVNAASLLDNSLAPGETIVVRGAGFGSDAQLLFNGAATPAISLTPTAIIAAVPSDAAIAPMTVQVQSGGALSNEVLVNVTPTSPGLFSTDGSGVNQSYIRNQDGSLNSPSNPAHPGDRITVFATGVGPVTFTDGYAVTQFPADLYIDGFHCDGVAAVMGNVAGLSGSVYQLMVYVPDPAMMAAANPNLLNFTFPPQVGVVLEMNGARSQNGLAISIAK
ncbi:MAG TPA: SBBP repeat-containing protein [Bryobacteraceae bacterium]|nr:SBBP repeat-containing protein [Bryobacteraceae bacterium]